MGYARLEATTSTRVLTFLIEDTVFPGTVTMPFNNLGSVEFSASSFGGFLYAETQDHDNVPLSDFEFEYQWGQLSPTGGPDGVIITPPDVTGQITLHYLAV